MSQLRVTGLVGHGVRHDVLSDTGQQLLDDLAWSAITNEIYICNSLLYIPLKWNLDLSIRRTLELGGWITPRDTRPELTTAGYQWLEDNVVRFMSNISPDKVEAVVQFLPLDLLPEYLTHQQGYVRSAASRRVAQLKGEKEPSL